MNASHTIHARSTAGEVLAGEDLTHRTALVTGGTTGLGLETARALAAAGATVTLTTRAPVAASDLPRELAGSDQLVLDLADLRSVRRAVESWSTPLDIVVANAGVMALPTRQLSAEGWELQLATNFLGHFALVVGLHEHLRGAAASSGESRVVVVSSGAHRSAPLVTEDLHFERRPYDRWVAYGQSKTADVLFGVAAADRWAGDGIVANSANPGFVNTGLQRHVDDDTMRALGAMDEDGNLIEGDHYKTPEQGASTAALLAGSATVAGVTGQYFEDNARADVVADGDYGVAPHAVDPQVADWLWNHALETIR